MDIEIPYPMTAEDYQLLCECFGCSVIDEIIEEYENDESETNP